MHLSLYGPAFARQQVLDWQELFQAAGFARVVTHDMGDVPDPLADAIVVVAPRGDAVAAARFWLSSLVTPTVIITPACQQVSSLTSMCRALRMVVHPLYASPRLVEIMALVRDMYAGTVVLLAPEGG